MRTLLLTPPMTQLNAPYPATTLLTGFLRSRGHDARQADLSLALALRLLSPAGVQAVALEAERWLEQADGAPARDAIAFFVDAAPSIARVMPGVVAFLQGRDDSLAHRIAARTLLPEGPRFAALDEAIDDGLDAGFDPLGEAFGLLGVRDRARYLATLFVEELADVVAVAVDPHFALVKYGESLAESQPTFDAMAGALAAPTLLSGWLDALVDAQLAAHEPLVVAITAPFAGNALGALRIGQRVKRMRPDALVVLGGGWVNTDLRWLREPRLFDYVDRVVLDAGEAPLLALLEGRPAVRTFRRQASRTADAHSVVFDDDASARDVPFAQTGVPTTAGLPMGSYLSMIDLLNPAHRLWSDGPWHKLAVAHGCYWKRCTFCDISLDYIARYQPAGVEVLLDRIASLIDETGTRGFHFVDEAAPPRQLRLLAEGLAARGLDITWWGNVRFERAFTPALAEQLADSGCIALTGGLEVASDRLLGLIDKGVTVAQVARTTRALTDAGILVHAYLMYGYPTQTVQETVDSLEVVRQLFVAGCLHSAFWHRFTATFHSPVGRDPARFGVTLLAEPTAPFCNNAVAFDDPTGVDHAALGAGLRAALRAYMHGQALDAPVDVWFDGLVDTPAPPTRHPPDLVAAALVEAELRSEREGRSA